METLKLRVPDDFSGKSRLTITLAGRPGNEPSALVSPQRCPPEARIISWPLKASLGTSPLSLATSLQY